MENCLLWVIGAFIIGAILGSQGKRRETEEAWYNGMKQMYYEVQERKKDDNYYFSDEASKVIEEVQNEIIQEKDDIK